MEPPKSGVEFITFAAKRNRISRLPLLAMAGCTKRSTPDDTLAYARRPESVEPNTDSSAVSLRMPGVLCRGGMSVFPLVGSRHAVMPAEIVFVEKTPQKTNTGRKKGEPPRGQTVPQHQPGGVSVIERA